MIPTKKKESNKTNQKNRDPIDTDVTIASSLAQIMLCNSSPAAPSGKNSRKFGTRWVFTECHLVQ
jgi:hypothetical protein